jgi:hypothetical protein
MEHEFHVGLKPRLTMKASLSTAHYAARMMPYGLWCYIVEVPMKLVRRDEVARLYGISGSVKNTFSQVFKNNLCLTI